MGAEPSLLDQVFDRLTDDGVSQAVAELILAAYTGDDQLEAALAGQTPDLLARNPADRPRPQPFYLKQTTALPASVRACVKVRLMA